VGNGHIYTAFFLEGSPGLETPIGAFQSGLIGYVTHERVINLDGKMNQRALYWRRLQRVECYLTERGIRTVVIAAGDLQHGGFSPGFAEKGLRLRARVPGGSAVLMDVIQQPICRSDDAVGWFGRWAAVR
jgi:hypothetical protein